MTRLVVHTAALVAAMSLTRPANAQSSSVRDSAQRTPLEGTLGVISHMPPGVDRPGIIVGAQTGFGVSRSVRYVLAAAYLRELGSSPIRCCGPNPGFGYKQEAVLLGVGPEFRLTSTGALALDLQYNPTFHHTIRRGSQADFRPSPTRWQGSLAVGSIGAAWRWRLANARSLRVGVRAYADLSPPVLLARGKPVPWITAMVGFGRW